MGVIWVCAVVISVLFGAATGRAAAVGEAALSGAAQAVELCLSIGGMICLWSAVMEVMARSGISKALSRLLRPVLCRLFPMTFRDTNTAAALSENVSANLLGLGNAATPAGIRAAKGILKLHGENRASSELCRLVVMNTASIQLLPTTIAAVRAAAGAENAFDILPAVWISSAVSVCVGLLAAKIMEKKK